MESIEDLAMLFAILFGLMIVSLIFLAIIKKKQDAEDQAQPVRKEMAKVVDKQQIDSGGIVIGEPWVLFEVEGGTRVRLSANPKNSLVIGDTGMLTWQGCKILRFDRNLTK